MLWALMQSVLMGGCNVFWKKSLTIFGHEYPWYVFAIFGTLGGLGICVIYFLTGGLSLNDLVVVPVGFLALLVLLTVITFFRVRLTQYVWERERMSVLMPFLNLNRVFSIVASYIIYQDVSLFTFVMTLAIIAVIVLFSVDRKQARLPRVFWPMVAAQILTSVRFLLMGFIVLSLSEQVFYVYDRLLYFLLLLIVIVCNGQSKGLVSFDANFYRTRLAATIMGSVSTVIGIFLIAELGMSMVILLSFLQLAVTLSFGYFYLKDVPRSKDLVLTLLVTGMIAVGVFFG